MKSFYQFAVFLILVQVILSCSTPSSGNDAIVQSPNIIFILTDDQGWTHTSHRADPSIPESKSDFYETPHMDRMAEMGILFTQGYAPNPICSPTRNSLLFGQNAARHIYNKDFDWYKKTDDWLTLPKAIRLANADYRTAHFGKWHIAKVPKDAGFDVDDGMSSNGGGEIFQDGFLNAKDYSDETEKYLLEKNIPNSTNARIAGKPSAYWSDPNPKDIFGITQKAQDFMTESIEAGRPFFVQLSHYATHLSLSSGKESYAYFKNKKAGERHTNPEFAAMLKDLDTGIGMILDFVKQQGIGDNTYIFLMGDNGGRTTLNQIAVIDENRQLVEARYSTQHDRNYPLRDGKHSFYEGGLRVPFLAVGPGIEANRVCETPVSGLDFLPTFAELAGYEGAMPDYIDGGSLVPLLHGDAQQVIRNREAFIFHQASHRKPKSAIRKGDYKLVKYWKENATETELYDLSNDLRETNDLSKEFPEISRDLEMELNEFLAEVGAETGERDIEGAYYRLLDDLGLRNNDSDE